jgi:hypothetical protein
LNSTASFESFDALKQIVGGMPVISAWRMRSERMAVCVCPL